MVILDPGHGYNTRGKRSPVWDDGSQLFEWEFNRDIVRRIQGKLLRRDIPSMILVMEAYDVSLRVRVERTNAICRQYPNSFIISVHGNAGGGRGWEIYTSRGKTESDLIATIFYEKAMLYLKDFKMRHDFSDGDPDKEVDFYILKRTICPAVLTENLFYDNEKECRYMLSDYGRNNIADLHLYSIIDYLKLKGLYN